MTKMHPARTIKYAGFRWFSRERLDTTPECWESTHDFSGKNEMWYQVMDVKDGVWVGQQCFRDYHENVGLPTMSMLEAMERCKTHRLEDLNRQVRSLQRQINEQMEGKEEYGW